jgi:hypothetical protein
MIPLPSSSSLHSDRRSLSDFSPTLLPFSLLVCLGVVSFLPFRLFVRLWVTGHAPKILAVFFALHFEASRLLHSKDVPCHVTSIMCCSRQALQNPPPNLEKSYYMSTNNIYIELISVITSASIQSLTPSCPFQVWLMAAEAETESLL